MTTNKPLIIKDNKPLGNKGYKESPCSLPTDSIMETQPHKCPVCNGNGLVPNGFYDQTSGTWSTGVLDFETCKSCQGKGVIWPPTDENLTQEQLDLIADGRRLREFDKEMHALIDEETCEPIDQDNFTFAAAEVACKYAGLQ